MRPDPERLPLFPTLIDRLIDEDAQTRTDARLTRRQTADRLVRSIVVDVAKLLNTRARFVSPPPHLTELKNSLLTYGLMDFSGGDFVGTGYREKLREEIESVLEKFEPRLSDVSVQLLEPSDPVEHKLRFQITAKRSSARDSVAFELDFFETEEEFRIAEGEV